MSDAFSRSDMIFEGASSRLHGKTVLVVGLGGVGGAVIEGLVRTGIDSFVIVDDDVVECSNLNRQIIATTDTIGVKKTAATRNLILSVNPNAKIVAIDTFYKDGIEIFDGVDYVVDAIDTVSSKVALIDNAVKRGIPVISSMGTGNKSDVTALRVADISETTVCPLARAVRKALRDVGIIDGVKVVYSTEQPKKIVASSDNGRHTPASAIFVPFAAGLIIAETVIEDLLGRAQVNG